MSWYVCKVCGQEMQTYEKTFHDTFCVNLSPNDPTKRAPPGFGTPAAETTRVHPELQNISHSSASFMSANIFPPAKNAMQSAHGRGQTSSNFATPADETIRPYTEHQNMSHPPASLNMSNILGNETMKSGYERGQISPNFPTYAEKTMQVNTNERQNMAYPSKNQSMSNILGNETIKSGYERGQISPNFPTYAEKTKQVNTNERQNMAYPSINQSMSNILGDETIKSGYERGQIPPNFPPSAEKTTQVNTNERQNISYPSTNQSMSNILGNETIKSGYERGQISPNFPTSAENFIQARTELQNTPRTSTSQVSPDVHPPVNETIPSAFEAVKRQQPSTASSTQPISPYYCPYSSPEVQVSMKNVEIYQAVYEKATERSIEAVRKTVDSLYLVHRAVKTAAAISSEKRRLAFRAQQLYVAFKNGKEQQAFGTTYSALSKTLAELQEMTAKENDALYFFETALLQEKDAFDAMLKASNSKHDAFKAALSCFYKKETTIDDEYFKSKRILPPNNTSSFYNIRMI